MNGKGVNRPRRAGAESRYELKKVRGRGRLGKAEVGRQSTQR